MFTTLGTVFTSVIGYVGQFVTALTSETGQLGGLQELFVLGIGISLLMVCAKLVRKITWGA